MKFALLTVAALIAGAAAAPLSEEQYQFLFSKFTQQFNKQYEVSEIFTKFNTFKSNLDVIVAHNAMGKNWTMGVNKFTDMTTAEFSQFMGLNVVETAPEAPLNATAPCPGMKANGSYIDWNEKNVMNPVKNQGSCGSCWAFAAYSSLEPRVAIATGKLYDLSEQQLVDCSGSTGNQGCNGGLMSNAYNYLAKQDSICTTAGYPYTARGGVCAASTCGSTAPIQVTGYKNVASNDAAHIDALQSGPVAVAIAASSSAFQFYKTGVVDNCPDRSINHGVAIVAYGLDSTSGLQYYNVRNSWGASWGDNGHIKLAVGKSPCGLTTSSFDVVPAL